MPKKILVIDVDHSHSQDLTNELQQKGYTVDAVSSPIQLPYPPQLDHADIILLNCLAEDVIAISKQLQQQKKPFLFFGTHQCENYIAKITEFGALGFLLKPIDAEQLVIEIETAWHWHWEKLQLDRRRVNIDNTIENNRKISVAIGILMDRYLLKATDAFNLLRNAARNKQYRIVDCAANIIVKLETSLPQTNQDVMAIQKEIEKLLD